MTSDQKLLAEVLKLKMYLVKMANQHQLTVYTEDVLDKVNDIIKVIEQTNQG